MGFGCFYDHECRDDSVYCTHILLAISCFSDHGLLIYIAPLSQYLLPCINPQRSCYMSIAIGPAECLCLDQALLCLIRFIDVNQWIRYRLSCTSCPPPCVRVCSSPGMEGSSRVDANHMSQSLHAIYYLQLNYSHLLNSLSLLHPGRQCPCCHGS